MPDGHPITRAASGKPFRCIRTRQGTFAIIDADDYDFLAQWKWTDCAGYAMRQSRDGSSANGAPKRNHWMHRVVADRAGMGIADLQVDHVNRSSLDNRRCNLRPATISQNGLNSRRSSVAAEERDPIRPADLMLAMAVAADIAERPPQFGPIRLSKGMVAIVDPEDFEWAMQWSWSFTGIYAARGRWETSSIYMHVEIGRRMGLLGPKFDHRNGDHLDNRRGNLRSATHRQNMQNRKRPRNNTSGYKGVTRDKGSGRWVAQIGSKGKHYWLGSYDSPEDAHAAYKAKAVELFGEFARFE